MHLNMPDITKAQLLAAILWVVNQAVSWGWINNDQGQIVVSASGSLVAFAWIIGDAVIRNGRAKAAGIAAAGGSTLTTTGKTV